MLDSSSHSAPQSKGQNRTICATSVSRRSLWSQMGLSPTKAVFLLGGAFITIALALSKEVSPQDWVSDAKTHLPVATVLRISK